MIFVSFLDHFINFVLAWVQTYEIGLSSESFALTELIRMSLLIG